MPDSCPCGSGAPEAACCGPIIAGAPAPSAVALMRSRYTAYVRGHIDYLVASHDESTRGEIDREAVESWSRDSQWLGLEIVATDRGGPADDTGVVEFIPRGKSRGTPFAHHERSRFRLRGEHWYFVDGKTVAERKAPTPGRNDPCPCGSGMKYKRCHGA